MKCLLENSTATPLRPRFCKGLERRPISGAYKTTLKAINGLRLGLSSPFHSDTLETNRVGMRFLKLVYLTLAAALSTLLAFAIVGSLASLMTGTPGQLGQSGFVASLAIGAIAAGFLAHRWRLWRGHWATRAAAAAVCLIVPVLAANSLTLIMAALVWWRGYP